MGNFLTEQASSATSRAAVASTGQCEGLTVEETRNSVFLVMDQLRDWREDGYMLVGLKRGNDRMGRLDVFRLHGFLFFKIHAGRGAEGGGAGVEELYARLDWGADGVSLEGPVDSELRLLDYSNKWREERRAALGGFFFVHGVTVFVGMVVICPSRECKTDNFNDVAPVLVSAASVVTLAAFLAIGVIARTLEGMGRGLEGICCLACLVLPALPAVLGYTLLVLLIWKENPFLMVVSILQVIVCLVCTFLSLVAAMRERAALRTSTDGEASTYVAVTEPRESWTRLIQYLELLDGKPYDLVDFNCNHFASGAVRAIEGGDAVADLARSGSPTRWSTAEISVGPTRSISSGRYDGLGSSTGWNNNVGEKAGSSATKVQAQQPTPSGATELFSSSARRFRLGSKTRNAAGDSSSSAAAKLLTLSP